MPKRSSKTPRCAGQPSSQNSHPSTGQVLMEKAETPVVVNEKNSAAVALGRLGGLKGGKARAAKLKAEDRTRIAQLAALARWGKKKKSI